MREIIENLDINRHVDYLLDTCFLFYMLKNGHDKALLSFCKSNSVGMTSFNLSEVEHVHHRLPGTLNHHARRFFKEKPVFRVPVDVSPGDFAGEKQFVQEYDPELLRLVPDASDAVMLVAALRLGANVLTRDKHHVFTTVCENFVQKGGITVLNELPK